MAGAIATFLNTRNSIALAIRGLNTALCWPVASLASAEAGGLSKDNATTRSETVRSQSSRNSGLAQHAPQGRLCRTQAAREFDAVASRIGGVRPIRRGAWERVVSSSIEFSKLARLLRGSSSRAP